MKTTITHRSTLSLFIAFLFCLPPVLRAQEPLTVLRATYSGGGVQRDVTALVNAKKQVGQIVLDVGNQTMGGDPAFGKVKSLTVLYQTSDGSYSVTVNEGQKLTLPSPSATRVGPVATAAASATPPTAQQHLAPNGVYYLLQRISVTTDSGITSFPPYTPVERVSESDGTMKVKSGDQEFDVQKTLLTNDLDFVQQGQRQVAQQQSFLQQTQQEQVQSAAEVEKLKESELQLVLVVAQVTDKGILARLPDEAYMEARGDGDDGKLGIGGSSTVYIEGAGGGYADGDIIKVKAFRDGVISYTSVLGAHCTVQRWVAVK